VTLTTQNTFIQVFRSVLGCQTCMCKRGIKYIHHTCTYWTLQNATFTISNCAHYLWWDRATCPNGRLTEHVFPLNLTLTLTLKHKNVFGKTKWSQFSGKCPVPLWCHCEKERSPKLLQLPKRSNWQKYFRTLSIFIPSTQTLSNENDSLSCQPGPGSTIYL